LPRQHDFPQSAVPKRVLADIDQFIWESNFLQLTTSGAELSVDFFDVVGQIESLQTVTVGKAMNADGGHAVRHENLFNIPAFRKRILGDFPHPLRDLDWAGQTAHGKP